MNSVFYDDKRGTVRRCQLKKFNIFNFMKQGCGLPSVIFKIY